MPLHLQTDHESIFFDNKTKSPFPTKLHLSAPPELKLEEAGEKPAEEAAK